MSFFDAKSFNPNVFLKYKETIKDPQVLNLLKANVFVGDPDLVPALNEQVGGNFITRNLVGILGGTPENYDGSTNITTSTLGTYTQGVVVIGRAHGFKEKDFTYDITHKDFMVDVANGIVAYWGKVNQGLLISILKGIFGSALASKVVSKSFANLDVADIVDALELNGDMAKDISVIAMHSHIAFALQKKNLLEGLKYSDKDGVERDTGLYAWDGRIVIIDDGVGATAGYQKTADTALVSGKTYYTESSGVYTAVANPDVSDIGDYYEATKTYPCYLMGAGAFTWQDVGAKVPVEMSRDPSTNGGEDVLYSRQRLVIAPFGVSFKQNAMSSKSPTTAELETASSWELVKDASNNAIELKTIPMSCMNITEILMKA